MSGETVQTGVSSEWGGLTHRLVRGVMFMPGVFACGRKTKLVVPPEHPIRYCPRCFPMEQPP